jgi:hypothetical protein
MNRLKRLENNCERDIKIMQQEIDNHLDANNSSSAQLKDLEEINKLASQRATIPKMATRNFKS